MTRQVHMMSKGISPESSLLGESNKIIIQGSNPLPVLTAGHHA